MGQFSMEGPALEGQFSVEINSRLGPSGVFPVAMTNVRSPDSIVVASNVVASPISASKSEAPTRGGAAGGARTGSANPYRPGSEMAPFLLNGCDDASTETGPAHP